MDNYSSDSSEEGKEKRRSWRVTIMRTSVV